jgi:hypothetical protein
MLLEENSMIPDFKGHHFVEDSKPGEFPLLHHCDRCGLKAVLTSDGSAEFHDGTVSSVRLSSLVQLSISLTPTCPAQNKTLGS